MNNVSSLAAKLRPYWLRDTKGGGATIINNYITEAPGGGGGVDLSWLVPRSFPMSAGAPLTVSGDFWSAGITYGLSLDSTGGLETSSGNLRVKLQSPSGLDRTSTGVALADAVAGNGLTIAAKVIALGTPSTLTPVSTNAVTSVSHTHSLDSASDVGTTPAQKILASTGTGGLILKTLQVKGNLDVTDGGDLYVAGSGAYAGNTILFADSNGGNVGIMGTPDPQFALDVFGPVRAQYFIGPHAIQLKNVLLLAHFDGRQPFETNYYGEPNGHMGQVAAVAGGVIYREGMFGTKAAQIAQGTTNLIVNPSFEVNTTDGWTFFESGTGGSMVRSSFRSHTGGYAGRIQPSSTGAATIRTADISVANGATIHFQARVWRNSAGSARLEIWNQTANASAALVDSALNNTWEHVATSWTNSTGSAVNVRLYIHNTAGGTSQDIYVDSVQAEIGTVATPYADGTLGDGHSWSGTAHNSTSTRTIANFRYPTAGNIDYRRGTVMAWVYRSGNNDTDTVLRLDGTVAGLIYLRCNGGQLQGAWGNTASISGGAVPARVWTHVAMTFSGTTLILYVNGVQVASGAASGFSGLPTEMYVGRSPGGSNFANGLIDDLVIISQHIPANEVRAIYESNAPVFAESSRFSFRATPRNLVWADDDGLWMRDTTGNAVFGFYGGEATGYTWGGALLDPGDILFGRGSQYMLWDTSAGKLTISGEMQVGTGVKDSTLNGWHISATDNEIVGQTSGVDQVVMGTDGKIKFAGGDGTLDAQGIAIRASSYAWDDPRGVKWTNSGGAPRAQIIGWGTSSAGGTRWSVEPVLYSYAYSELTVDTAINGDGSRAYTELYSEISGSKPRLQLGVTQNHQGVGQFLIMSPMEPPTSTTTYGGISLYSNSVGGSGEITLEVQPSFGGTSKVHLVADSINLIAPYTYNKGVISLGGTSDNIARLRPAGNHTVANNGTLNLGAPRGFVFVQNTSDQHGALYYLRGTTAIELLDSNGVFSPTQGTASSNNIYHDGSVWRLENTRGSSKSYEVIILGRSTDF
jgi:hypothetical protein